jgi:hypothetical protein
MTENYVDDITQCAYVSLGDAKHGLQEGGIVPLHQLVKLRLAEKQPHRREVVMGDGTSIDCAYAAGWEVDFE